MRITKLRFSVFCLMIFSVVCLPIQSIVFKFDIKEDITYFFYTKKLDYQIQNANIVSNGNSSIVVCSLQNVRDVKSNLSDIYGESVRILNYSDATLKYITKKYEDKLVKTEETKDYKYMLCFDASLPQYVTIENSKVNVQIAISNNEIDIGYPLILNGY